MTMRVLIAGILGGIAMYIWSTIAHVALPLGQVGVSQMPNEAAVLAAAQASYGAKDRHSISFRGIEGPADDAEDGGCPQGQPIRLAALSSAWARRDAMAGPMTAIHQGTRAALIAAFLVSLASAAQVIGAGSVSCR